MRFTNNYRADNNLRDLIYRSFTTAAHKYFYRLIMLPVEETGHTTSGLPPNSLR